MDNPRFVNDESIPLIQDEDIDQDDQSTPNTSRLDETSITMPGSTEKETTLWLKQKVKQDILTVLYRHINIAGNLDLINHYRIRLTKDH